MAEKRPQTYANHTRLDPLFHFFLAPIALAAVIWALVHLFRHLGQRSVHGNVHAVLLVVIAVAMVIFLTKMRLYSLKVQDRVIRLEERLRLSQLLAEPLRSRIPELTEDQLIGLRFASDGEVAKLVERALNEKLNRKQIKQAVQNWRADYWRV